MKLRQIPEDFLVEEIAHHAISKQHGPYRIYLLQKRGIESFGLLERISRQNRVPREAIGIAGLKDKHAVTKQYLTVPARSPLKEIKEQNVSLVRLGYIKHAIKLGSLEGNKFTIVVRDLTQQEVKHAKERAATIPIIGVPNYFDSQRFGSAVDSRFIMRHILREEYEQAIKLFLTAYTRWEPKTIKDEKRYILQNWKDLGKVDVKNRQLSIVLKEYKKTRSWLSAYKKIPAPLREMYVGSYQSYLWNECAKETLRTAVGRGSLYGVAYAVGTLLFYKCLCDEEIARLPETFQTVSDEMRPTEFERNIVDTMLMKEEFTLDDFAIKKETGNFFKTHRRALIVRPTKFTIGDAELDEFNGRGNRFKLTIGFCLPKGSFATVVTKRIFGQ